MEVGDDAYWTHDCDGCDYLGSAIIPSFHHGGEVKHVDLYSCGQDYTDMSVIARYSSEPSDYASKSLGSVSLLSDTGLLIAAQIVFKGVGINGCNNRGVIYFKDSIPQALF